MGVGCQERGKDVKGVVIIYIDSVPPKRGRGLIGII